MFLCGVVFEASGTRHQNFTSEKNTLKKAQNNLKKAQSSLWQAFMAYVRISEIIVSNYGGIELLMNLSIQ